MFAQIAPIVRLPRDKQVFDYRVPEDLTVHVGSFVHIPFRRRSVVGVVIALTKTSSFKRIAEIEGQAENMPPLSGPDIAFYQRLAKRTYQSLGSILYASIPSQPKRTHKTPPRKIDPVALSVSPREAAAAQEIVSMLLKTAQSIVALPSRRTGIASIIGLLKTSQDPLLVICPDRFALQSVEESVSPLLERYVVWDGTSNKTEAFAAWQALRMGSERLVIATRLGALIPPHPSVRIVLLSTGDKEYMQQEQNPHYDAQWCLQARAESHKNPATFLGILPRTEDGNLTVDAWSKPNDVRVIDMKAGSKTGPHYFLSKELITSLQTTDTSSMPYILYFNRKSTPEHDRIGNQELASILRELLKLPVVVMESGSSLPDSGIVIATRALFHQASFSKPAISGIGVVHADHEYVYRGFRSLENGARDIRRLVDLATVKQAPCIIQTWSPDSVHQALGSTEMLHDQERDIRKRLQYPPYGSFVLVRSKEPSELIASYRMQHIDVHGDDTQIVQKTTPDGIIEALLTWPNDCDILVNPDILMT